MAKKKKPASVRKLRSRLRETIGELERLDRDLARVQTNLQRFLKQPRFGGEDDYFVDLRAKIRRTLKGYKPKRR